MLKKALLKMSESSILDRISILDKIGIINGIGNLDNPTIDDLIPVIESEFDKDFNEILGELSKIESFRSLGNARLNGQANSVLDFDQLTQEMNMSEEGLSYLERVLNLFDESIDGTSENINEIGTNIHNIKLEVQDDEYLNPNEVESLIMSCDMLTANLNDMLVTVDEVLTTNLKMLGVVFYVKFGELFEQLSSALWLALL